MRHTTIAQSALRLCAVLTGAAAFVVDPTSKGKQQNDVDQISGELICLASLINGAQIAASNLIGFYDGYRSGGTIGMYQAPVYWWEAGAAWNVRSFRFAHSVLTIRQGVSRFLALHGQYYIQ